MTGADQIEDLLERLSSWEREYGTRFSDVPDLVGTGESNAMIAELKRRLTELGARFHWQASSRTYVLDSAGEPPGEEGEPT